MRDCDDFEFDANHVIRARRFVTQKPKHRYFPFHYNPELARKFARLHRLKAKGLTPAGDKASLRAMCDDAVRSHAPKPQDQAGR